MEPLCYQRGIPQYSEYPSNLPQQYFLPYNEYGQIPTRSEDFHRAANSDFIAEGQSFEEEIPVYQRVDPPIGAIQPHLSYPKLTEPLLIDKPLLTLSEDLPLPEKKKKRMQVKRACARCKRLCKGCSDCRPCKRCVKDGTESECIDVKRKSRIKAGTSKVDQLQQNKQDISPTPLLQPHQTSHHRLFQTNAFEPDYSPESSPPQEYQPIFNSPTSHFHAYLMNQHSTPLEQSHFPQPLSQNALNSQRFRPGYSSHHEVPRFFNPTIQYVSK